MNGGRILIRIQEGSKSTKGDPHFRFGGRRNNRVNEANSLRARFPSHFLGRSRKDYCPFFFLLNLPSSLLTLPVGSSIILKMKIDIKAGTNDTAKLVDGKTHMFREHRKSEVVVAQKFHMKIQSTSSKTGLDDEGNRILCGAKEESLKSHK